MTVEFGVIFLIYTCYSLCTWMVDEFGNDHQRKHWIPKLASMEVRIWSISTGIIWFDLKQIAIQTLSTVSYIEKCAL